MMMKMKTGADRVIGVIPAAGYSRRISPIPCSKEIYPVGFFKQDGSPPKAVCLYLIESMREAGIKQIFIVIRKGKFDIPRYLGDGDRFGVQIAYRVMEDSLGPPYALDNAYPFVEKAIVASGFPDIVFYAPGAFTKLLTRLRDTGSDITFGVFRIKKAIKDDRLVLDRRGRVVRFAVSTAEARHSHTWVMAVWGPRFTEFMHDFLAHQTAAGGPAEELTVGHVLEPAFEAGLRMSGVHFRKGRYLDIGTPNTLRKAVRQLSRPNGTLM